MYSIFAPLDPNEQLPRELLNEAKRYRHLGRRELAGALWLPSLFVVLSLGAWQNVSSDEALGAVLVLFAGFGAFALSDHRRGRP